MSREYMVSMNSVTVTAAAANFAIVFVNPGTTASLEFLRFAAGQGGTATSAMYGVAVQTQVTAFPTLTSTTPSKTKLLDPVSAITGNTNGAAGTSGTNASVAGAGAKTTVFSDNFNNLNGYLWVPTPRETLIMNASAASGIGLYWMTTPGSLTLWTAYCTYAELG